MGASGVSGINVHYSKIRITYLQIMYKMYFPLVLKTIYVIIPSSLTVIPRMIGTKNCK